MKGKKKENGGDNKDWKKYINICISLKKICYGKKEWKKEGKEEKRRRKEK